MKINFHQPKATTLMQAIAINAVPCIGYFLYGWTVFNLVALIFLEMVVFSLFLLWAVLFATTKKYNLRGALMATWALPFIVVLSGTKAITTFVAPLLLLIGFTMVLSPEQLSADNFFEVFDSQKIYFGLAVIVLINLIALLKAVIQKELSSYSEQGKWVLIRNYFFLFAVYLILVIIGFAVGESTDSVALHLRDLLIIVFFVLRIIVHSILNFDITK